MSRSGKVLPPFKVELLNLPDERLALHVWAWWIGAEALKPTVPDGTPIDEAFVERVRRHVLEIDSDDAASVALEKALKCIAKNDLARGGKIFRDWIGREGVFLAAIDESKTGRRKQKKLSTLPRTDNLQSILIEIIRAKPAISKSEMLDALALRAGGEIIVEIADGSIWFQKRSGVLGQAPISGLPHRMSRARKFLKSR